MDLKLEKVLETLYTEIVENLPADVCCRCPVVALVGNLCQMIKQDSISEVAMQLGIDGRGIACPCAERKS